MKVRLTESEKQRIEDLNKIWDVLYEREEYQLCDLISKEIGIIKEVEW